MKLHELFPEISSNPASSKVIKQWILQLAVEGKLTKKWREENPNIDSSDLLKKINIEKTDLIKSKKIKKETFDALQYDDLIDIPKNWIWLRLGEIGFIFNGDSINATVKEQRYTNIEEGYPYVSTKDVGYGFEDIDLNNGVKIPKDEPKFKLARKNTILICAEGGSAGKKMGIITEESCFGNKLFAIHEFGGISSKFILIFYGSVFFQNEFQSRMSGIIGGISRNKFSEIPICIPPLEEQQAIVSIVEELFKEVDTLSQQATEHIALKRSYAQATLQSLCEADTFEEWQQIVSVFTEIFNDKQTIKTLRETILQLAVQGKLTTKWRISGASLTTYQTAHELLAQIKAEKAQLIKEKKIKAEKPLPPIEDNEIPFELPDGWVWCRLGDSCINITDGTHQTPKYTDTGRPFLSAKNVKPFSFLPDKHKFVSEEDFQHYIINRKPEKNDILLTRVGAGIGEAAVIDLDFEFAIYVSVALLKIPFNFISSKFMELWLNSPIGRNNSRVNTYGIGVSQGNLNLGLIRNFVYSLPPLVEQLIIVDKVNALMGLCDELDREVEKKQNLLSRII